MCVLLGDAAIPCPRIVHSSMQFRRKEIEDCFLLFNIEKKIKSKYEKIEYTLHKVEKENTHKKIQSKDKRKIYDLKNTNTSVNGDKIKVMVMFYEKLYEFVKKDSE